MFYLPFIPFFLTGDLYSPPDVKEDVILGSLISKCDPFSVTILLFIAYNLVVMSRAINVDKTVAKYVSFTNKYSKAVLCQYKYLQVLAATIET